MPAFFQCLNLDGVTTYLSVSYQYRVRANDLRDIIMQFQNSKTFQDILYNIGNVLSFCITKWGWWKVLMYDIIDL